MGVKDTAHDHRNMAKPAIIPEKVEKMASKVLEDRENQRKFKHHTVFQHTTQLLQTVFLFAKEGNASTMDEVDIEVYKEHVLSIEQKKKEEYDLADEFNVCVVAQLLDRPILIFYPECGYVRLFDRSRSPRVENFKSRDPLVLAFRRYHYIALKTSIADLIPDKAVEGIMTKAQAKATTPALVALQWLHGYAPVQVAAAFEGEPLNYSTVTENPRNGNRLHRVVPRLNIDTRHGHLLCSPDLDTHVTRLRSYISECNKRNYRLGLEKCVQAASLVVVYRLKVPMMFPLQRS